MFLGRSGTDRKTANELVEELKVAGARVGVVRGDVTSIGDVEKLVSQVEGPVGGIIHAAMGLSVSALPFAGTNALALRCLVVAFRFGLLRLCASFLFQDG